MIITGASSGLGLAAAKSLADSGQWHVIMVSRISLRSFSLSVAVCVPSHAAALALPHKCSCTGIVLPIAACNGVTPAVFASACASDRCALLPQACRNYAKAIAAAKEQGIPEGAYTVMHLDLASLDSVRQFVSGFRASGRRLDVLVCNAAIYQPTAKEPSYTADGARVPSARASVSIARVRDGLACWRLLQRPATGPLSRMPFGPTPP